MIYVTPFAGGECSGPSQPLEGVGTVAEAVTLLGVPASRITACWAITPGLFVSRIPWAR